MCFNAIVDQPIHLHMLLLSIAVPVYPDALQV